MALRPATRSRSADGASPRRGDGAWGAKQNGRGAWGPSVWSSLLGVDVGFLLSKALGEDCWWPEIGEFGAGTQQLHPEMFRVSTTFHKKGTSLKVEPHLEATLVLKCLEACCKFCQCDIPRMYIVDIGSSTGEVVPAARLSTETMAVRCCPDLYQSRSAVWMNQLGVGA